MITEKEVPESELEGCTLVKNMKATADILGIELCLKARLEGGWKGDILPRG